MHTLQPAKRRSRRDSGGREAAASLIRITVAWCRSRRDSGGREADLRNSSRLRGAAGAAIPGG